MVLLGGFLGLILAIYLILGFAIQLLVPYCPAGIERGLGKLFGQSLYQEELTEETARVQLILDGLTSALSDDDRRLEYRVRVENNPAVNAIALPGGTILVYSGLINEVDSDDELAFVLGHELGHFHNRDHLKGLGRGLAMLIISLPFASSDGLISGFISDQISNLEMQFSQSQEHQADLFGLRLIAAQGKNLDGALNFMQDMADENKTPRLAYYFATHPHPEERLDLLKAEAERLR